MIKIDCKKYAQEIKDYVKNSEKSGKLIILYAGDDKANESYMKGKVKDAEECGIEVIKKKCNNALQMYYAINGYNSDDSVGGIMIQLPLPEGFVEKDFQCVEDLTGAIAVSKDVDGFRRGSKFKPCTPEGIMYVLERECNNLKGKHVVLIGKGKLVGKPLINMLLDKGVTLSVVSSNTREIDKQALMGICDIVITCVGKNGVVELDKVNPDIVIDAGFDYVDGHVCGDCKGYNWTGNGSKVTSVPGGIGLMTRAMLMKHMVK